MENSIHQEQPSNTTSTSPSLASGFVLNFHVYLTIFSILLTFWLFRASLQSFVVVSLSYFKMSRITRRSPSHSTSLRRRRQQRSFSKGGKNSARYQILSNDIDDADDEGSSMEMSDYSEAIFTNSESTATTDEIQTQDHSVPHLSRPIQETLLEYPHGLTRAGLSEMQSTHHNLTNSVYHFNLDQPRINSYSPFFNEVDSESVVSGLQTTICQEDNENHMSTMFERLLSPFANLLVDCTMNSTADDVESADYQPGLWRKHIVYRRGMEENMAFEGVAFDDEIDGEADIEDN